VHDFGRFVYLDMQKTGSTYTSKFLQHTCKLPEVRYEKHVPVRDSFSRTAFYFITIRHPLSLYSSLYRYGLDRRGGVFHRLEQANLLNVYSDFDEFLTFVLSPENSAVLGEGYTPDIARHIGFMSFRFLKLSLRYPLRTIDEYIARKNSLLNFAFPANVMDLQKEFIPHLEIKNENLKDELANLALVRFPECFDETLVLAFLSESEGANESKTKASQLNIALSENIFKTLKNREKVLWSRYDCPPSF
jgi:hypothetical protein